MKTKWMLCVLVGGALPPMAVGFSLGAFRQYIGAPTFSEMPFSFAFGFWWGYSGTWKAAALSLYRATVRL